MAYFLGIDGGGTRTTAWLADADGNVLARTESATSNPFKVGLAAAQHEILKAFHNCLRDAGIRPAVVSKSRPRMLRAVCAGISGSGRPEVHRPLLAWMRQHIPARRHLLTTDAAIALAAAVRDKPGIVVNGGTGSFAYARDDQGKLFRAGGWGVPFDDRGSGYDLGRKAVAVALEAYDGRGPQTQLGERICRHLKLGNVTEIVSRQLASQEVAALFPLVSEAARDGDRVARRLCDEAALDLADLAAALLKRAGWMRRAIAVVITGGVFQSSELIRRGFARYMRRAAPRVRVRFLERPPVEGALWLSRNLGRRKS